jgi:mono/diheme cytochrome c family protein
LGLQLNSYEGAITGSQDGPVLIPGDPDGSELIRRVRGLSQPQMPLIGDYLTDQEIGRIEAWILAGLPEGGAGAAEAEAQADEFATTQEGEAEAPETLGPGSQEAEAQQMAEPSGEPANGQPALPGPGERVTFAHVERIFLQRCVECHSDARAEGPPEGLRLDNLENILAGGERLVLIPGNLGASEIIRRIEGTAQPRMPFDGPPWLDPEQIELIRRWIEDGASDAEGTLAPMPVGREVRYRGTLTGPQEIDGAEFRITPETRIDERPAVGEEAEVRGVVAEDGGIEATRFRDR